MEEQSLQSEKIEISEKWTPDILYWIKELYHIYKSKYVETVALKNINIQIKRNKISAIFGPSGSGKTTFLNIISGLLLPTTGRIYVKSDPTNSEIQNLARMGLEDRTSFRRDNIGFIFQEFKLFDKFTIEENLHIPLLIRNINPVKMKPQIDEILKECGIEQRREYKIEHLSGGEKQRVQIAMASVFYPKIIIADEPTGNLDSSNAKKIFELLKSINFKYNTTIIVVSHDKKIEKYTDSIIDLEKLNS